MIISIVRNGQTLVPLTEFEGKTVVIKEWKDNRSGRQNRYWHGVVLPYWMEYTGHSKEEMKHWLKFTYGPMVVITVKRAFGESTLELPKATSDMTTKEMSAFIDACCIGYTEVTNGGKIPPAPYDDSND